MSHRSSPSSVRRPILAVLLVLMLGVLASCTNAPDSPSPDEPDNHEPPPEESQNDGLPDNTSVTSSSDVEGDSVGESAPADSSSEEPASEAQDAATTAETESTSTSTAQTESSDIDREAAADAAEDEADAEIANQLLDSNTESLPPPSESPDTADAVEEDLAEEGAVPVDDIEDGQAPPPESNPDSSNSEPSESSDGLSAEETGDRAWRLVRNRGRLRVGIDPTIGYTYLRANTDTMSFEGFEWDILKAIGEELEIEIEPVYIPWDNQLDALESNRVDTILGGRDALGVDETRFATTIPYYSSPQRIIVREELSEEIQHLSDLFGRKVGTVADSAGAAVVEVFNRDRANALTLLSSPNPSRLFEQLRQSQVDAIVIDQPVAVAEVAIAEAAAIGEDSSPSDNGDNPATGSIVEASDTSDAEVGNVSESEPDSVAPIDTESSAALEHGASDSPSTVPSEAELSEVDSTASTALEEGEPTNEVTPNEETSSEVATSDVSLRIVGEPMFPTPLVGVVKAENASIGQALDEAIATLERNGTITAILEKWEL